MPQYSPILAAVTGCLEILAAVYTFRGPGRKSILRPVGLIFILLAAYQFAEIAVCANPAVLTLSRLAYIIIAWQAPVALRLVVVLDARNRSWLRIASLFTFAAAAGLCVWIVIDPGCITKSVCQVVTARYFPAAAFNIAYGVFFQSALVFTVFSAGIVMASTEDPASRKHLANLQLGILGFMFPALAVRVLAAEPAGLIPSVMCHFALVLAASLVALVVRERRLAGKLSDR
jgi:hypothetical protein